MSKSRRGREDEKDSDARLVRIKRFASRARARNFFTVFSASYFSLSRETQEF